MNGFTVLCITTQSGSNFLISNITDLINFSLKGMHTCKNNVSKEENCSNIFLFINLGLISYPMTRSCFENNLRIGLPISPNPTTIFFFCFMIRVFLLLFTVFD